MCTTETLSVNTNAADEQEVSAFVAGASCSRIGELEAPPTLCWGQGGGWTSWMPQESRAMIGYAAKPMDVQTGHLLFSKKCSNAEEYLQAFNRGLKKLKENGTYDKYLEDMIQGKYAK